MTEEKLIPRHARASPSSANNVERFGVRCTAYSTWHRTLPAPAAMVDVDSVESCKRCQQPLALIETARSGGAHSAETKPHWVTRNLALLAGLPAFVLIYDTDDENRITGCTVRRVAPSYDDARKLSPQLWQEFLLRLHREHLSVCRGGGKYGK